MNAPTNEPSSPAWETFCDCYNIWNDMTEMNHARDFIGELELRQLEATDVHEIIDLWSFEDRDNLINRLLYTHDYLDNVSEVEAHLERVWRLLGDLQDADLK